MRFPTRLCWLAPTALAALLLVVATSLPLAGQEQRKAAASDDKIADKRTDRQGEKADRKKETQSQKDDAGKRGMPGVTAAREAAALAFVHEHHPELEQLLTHLKKKQPKQYQAAIRDLFRVSERLATVHEKDRTRYELALEEWKLSSRIQLLSARAMMSTSDAELKKQLRDALEQQIDVRRQLLEFDRARAQERAERLTAQLERLEANREKMVEQQLKTLLDGQAQKTQPAAPARQQVKRDDVQ